MPETVLLTFSDAQKAKLGACKNKTEWQAAIDTAIEQLGASKTENKVVALSDVEAIFAKNIETVTASTGALETKFVALEGRVNAVNPENILKQAKDAASITAAEKLGQVGASGAGAIRAEGNEGGAPADNLKQLEAAGKFEELWAADPKAREEFSDAKSFAAYKKAEAKGAFRLYKPTN